MSYQIILQLEDVAGAIARVMSGLRKLGISIVEQSFEARPEGGRNLILEVEGPQLSDEQLRTPLEALNGVAKLLSGAEEAGADIPAQVSTDAKPELPDTRYKDKNSEAGDADMRDRMLIFSLLSRYPNISGRLLEIDSSIPESERPQRMLELGQGFGGYLYKNLKVKKEVFDLRSAIELLIIPGLAPLVQISQYAEGVKVSGFTKNMKHAGQKTESCQFLAGTIQGLMDSVPTLPTHHVEKTQCIHAGAISCEYRLSPA
ncbi:hypothetical protein [Sedimenticola selenatireducens]|uniref:ACT domain-containing protein n=1 Tax=Sedimenticola selenatireducens TaxID=191960 RepID=A0A558DLN2_9GAMM|nr:hypothetical protein [Sedimenticola selenatireducens]TVO69534.1 hypothetical protein FHP88_17940 [Sedimenticola selenatireducens]TVT61927.1 MAG: hypothetical protein FHK78_16155 [Sedimenticola selenatireducens]